MRDQIIEAIEVMTKEELISIRKDFNMAHKLDSSVGISTLQYMVKVAALSDEDIAEAVLLRS